MKIILTYIRILFLTGCITCSAIAKVKGQNLTSSIDSILRIQEKPFNGVILIAKDDKVLYSKAQGYADFKTQKPMTMKEQFILGSLSKQITAVLVLQQLDKGKLALNDPLRKYIPELTQPWADSVTIHHLLNHTSGIVDLNQPLEFKPGTSFAYSPVVTNQLLSKIIEKTSGKSYSRMAMSLFATCKMKNTFTPAFYSKGTLVKSYLFERDSLTPQEVDLKNLENYVAGAGIISTAEDLLKWNLCLHQGKLLSKDSYELMITPSAIRHHAIWGEVGYGYGIQIDKTSGTELGHSGYFQGYNSAVFYYTSAKASVIVLSNVDWFPYEIKNTFTLHTQVEELAKKLFVK